MIDGILLINKERNITSYDVIRKLKKVLPKGQKIGHGGTLDPFATGVLVILLGRGTKQMNRIHSLKKTYVVKAEFGYSTDTQDITGTKMFEEKRNIKIGIEDIEKKIQNGFIGEILQTPPSYSAKKIAGRKAYELARKGEEVKLSPVSITVDTFKILQYDWPYVLFEISCSTGTYIRTLVDDLGKSLGTYATAVELERTRIGEYDLNQSISSSDITDENLERIVNSVLNLEDINHGER